MSRLESGPAGPSGCRANECKSVTKAWFEAVTADKLDESYAIGVVDLMLLNGSRSMCPRLKNMKILPSSDEKLPQSSAWVRQFQNGCTIERYLKHLRYRVDTMNDPKDTGDDDETYEIYNDWVALLRRNVLFKMQNEHVQAKALGRSFSLHHHLPTSWSARQLGS